MLPHILMCFLGDAYGGKLKFLLEYYLTCFMCTFHFLHCQSLLWNFFWGVTNQFLLFGVAKHLQWNVFHWCKAIENGVDMEQNGHHYSSKTIFIHGRCYKKFFHNVLFPRWFHFLQKLETEDFTFSMVSVAIFWHSDTYFTVKCVSPLCRRLQQWFLVLHLSGVNLLCTENLEIAFTLKNKKVLKTLRHNNENHPPSQTIFLLERICSTQA